jgi:hypothetical protein
MSTHEMVGAVAGDDWEVRLTLLDASGAPYDLSGTPSILWAMADRSGRRVVEPNETTVSITDAAAGKCSVLIPASVTTRLAGGHYSDALRLITGGVTSTLLTGDWNVMADPFRQQVSSVITLRPAAREFARSA